jgi:CheY-like chemotaxis protein
VLVIDDDDDARTLLARHVEELGCTPVATGSGTNALRLARELHPDLITLDLRMPGMDGWELIERLKQDPALARIPVVVVSVIADESRASLLGAIDVLQKPVDRDALEAVLRRNVPGRDAARILVIDDAPDARRLLVDLLAGRAAEVRTAENGQAAIALLRTFEPDLVITDLLMPVMDGMTFVEVFRGTERFRDVPVIVITAKDLTPADREQLERHAAAVLQKGSALEADLRRVLADVLGRQPAAAVDAGAAP